MTKETRPERFQTHLAKVNGVITVVDDSPFRPIRPIKLEKRAEAEKARIYIKDPSRAPIGVTLNKGPRGGIWYDSSQVKRAPKRPKVAKPKLPKGGKGSKPKEPKAEKPPKREIGQPFTGIDDPNLPRNVQQEAQNVQEAWIKAFNDTLAAGGSEADALAAARETLPKRGAVKPPAPPRRKFGEPFQSLDDPTIPTSVQMESPNIKLRWVATFNATLKNGGSEADARHAANKVLPDRKATDKKKSTEWYVQKAWSEANQLRKPNGQFDGTLGGGGGSGGGAAIDAEVERISNDPGLQGELSKESEVALRDYVGEDHVEINLWLRNKEIDSPWTVEQMNASVLGIDNAMGVTTQQYTVYRGVSDHSDVVNLPVGSVYRDRGFVSTSASPDIAEQARAMHGDGGAILRVTVQPGAYATWVPKALNQTETTELELLLSRGMEYRVTGRSDGFIDVTAAPPRRRR